MVLFTTVKSLKSYITLYLFLYPLMLYAQPADSIGASGFAKYIDLRIENGLMLSNGTALGKQVVDNTYYNGFDVRFSFRNLDTQDLYSNLYRRPYLGLGWYTSTFNNASIGNPCAIYGFLTLPLSFEGQQKLTFAYSAAFGLAYNFNPYDSISNPMNRYIGSPVNCYVHLGLLMNYRFNSRWVANATVGFKHFSNGAYELPNAGINLIPLTVGLNYRLNQEDVMASKQPLKPYLNHYRTNITLSGARKNYNINNPNYLKIELSVNHLKQVSYKYRLGLGLDVVYAEKSELRNTSDQSAFSKSISYSVVGSWEWVLTKRLYVPIGLAVYLHRNFENGELVPYYERIGFRYQFAEHCHAGVTVKAHNAVADILEWSIGYTFHNNKN